MATCSRRDVCDYVAFVVDFLPTSPFWSRLSKAPSRHDMILRGLELPQRASPKSHLIELAYFKCVWTVSEIHFAPSLDMYWVNTEINSRGFLTVLP